MIAKSIRRKGILSGSGRERNLEKTFPSSSRQSLNWGIYSYVPAYPTGDSFRKQQRMQCKLLQSIKTSQKVVIMA
jgi:hypothetical protein